VLVVEVDVADAEAAQAGLAAGAHVLRLAAHGQAAGRALTDPELGGHLHLPPRQSPQRPAEEGLVGVGPVRVRGVEEGDPAAEGVLDDGGDGLVAERGVVGAREPHAPEPQPRHLQPLGAELGAGDLRRGGLLHGRARGCRWRSHRRRLAGDRRQPCWEANTRQCGRLTRRERAG